MFFKIYDFFNMIDSLTLLQVFKSTQLNSSFLGNLFSLIHFFEHRIHGVIDLMGPF